MTIALTSSSPQHNPQPTTEQRNPRSQHIHSFSAAEIVELMNAEDARVVAAVQRERANIAQAIEQIADRFRHGGRLFYLGAGTSGRLGVLDASECPPTFSTPPEMVVGLIAGGATALTRAIEGAEDDRQQAQRDLQQHQFSAADALVGIATSGGTPYVLGGLDYARSLGALTIGFSCNEASPIHQAADLVIAPVVGPEVVSGSTRLKAGTATKMVLNMLTTGAMILIGKTYGNWMVDLKASNSKLKLRSLRIVCEITGLTAAEASTVLERCQGEVKTAILCALRELDAPTARQRLAACGGQLRQALGERSAGPQFTEGD
ncbi:MAG: N-acetylmuramic acid 6-phosphate etherase [Planctomycetales bacterium]|nr:N-acetylmuramic acid 6-phosphate etherase [Planctomycetales bacterium]